MLFGWEFGGGLGHVVRLREIARHLGESRSCEFLFALQDPKKGVAAGLPRRSVVAVPAAKVSAAGTRAKPRETYGEYVSENLMIEDGAFAARLAGWDEIIHKFDPHLVIADYAPGLSLFARGRWPVLATGNGYTMPPPEIAAFPALAKLNRPLYATEPEIVDRLNKDLTRIGARPIERLPQLNEADAYGLVTLPFFDPYRAQRQQAYLGAEIPGGGPHPLSTASGGIAYFHEDTQLHDNVLDGLGGASIDMAAYFGKPLRRVAKKFEGTHVALVNGPFSLREDMPGRIVAIHRGSLGFAAAALLAGVPQVMAYGHEEHWFMANAIVKAGAGAAAPYKEVTASALAEAIDRVAGSSVMRERAQRLAAENAWFRDATPTRAVADIAAKLLRTA
ncbi:MAG: nucleotide disphospho-sugar-binding domain-containing protein [Aestuariivirga sp.]